MSMTWFKLHHEIIDDIKIRRFTPQEKWAWIVLLSLASKSSDRGIVEADNDDLADYCEFNSTQDWLRFKSKLISKSLIEELLNGSIRINSWSQNFEAPIKPIRRISGWDRKRKIIFERDNYTCVYCGAINSPLHCDHIHPKSKGGSDALGNLTTACESCNTSKGDKLIHEWRKNR